MNAATRTARQIIKARRNGNTKRTLATYVGKATKAETERKAVTTALRNAAKKLRDKGVLGKVQTRIGYVAEGIVGPTYRYTARQLAAIVAAYKPRKAEYKAVRAALIAA